MNDKTTNTCPVTWFEIPAKDLERAKNFYENVFKIKLEMADSAGGLQLAMFPHSPDMVGAGGALAAGPHTEPSDKGTVVYFDCEDLNNELERVEQLGGTVVFPKTSIGPHGFIAHFLDTEGNRVALHSKM